jgi:hypothetical protein
VSRDDGGDEYRFDPAAFDGATEGGGLDPVPAVIGGTIGAGGLLVLAKPFVDTVSVAGLRLPAAFLSVLFVGLAVLVGGCIGLVAMVSRSLR